MSKLSIKPKSNQNQLYLGILQMVASNKKKLPHFDPIAWVFSNGVEDTPLQQFLLSCLYSFDYIIINYYLPQFHS